MNPTVVLVPRFRNLDREIQHREDFASMPAEERDLARLERLNHNWAMALESGSYYRSLACRTNLPSRFRSLEEFRSIVPITPRQAICADPSAFRISGQASGKWMKSSGSSGCPAKVFWAKQAHLESLRDQYWARSWWGIAPFDRQAVLWGRGYGSKSPIQQIYQRWSMAALDQLRRRKRFDAWRLDHAYLRHCYDRMARFRPLSLYAYSTFAHLLAVANRDRPESLVRFNVAFLTSEPILSSHRQSIHEVFGCACAGEYGSVDCGLIAHQRGSHGYQVFERSVLVETIPNQTCFSILVTQLRETHFPLFRYEIGDMTIASVVREGNEPETLGELIGRNHDVIWSPSGTPCCGMALESIVEQSPEVAMYKIIQHRDFSMDIMVQTKCGHKLPTDQADRICEEVLELLGKDVQITIRSVDRIGRSPGGKHRYIESECNRV